MNPKKTSPPGDANEEISALIETLHQTGQRLEELTAGEVDTVANREGRTFMLRRAQEQLRHSGAAKQAAILNALPAHIALLDTQGRIISVNEAWRRFGSPNVLHGPGQGIGLNYLEICDSTRGDDTSEAHQIAEGIRSVLGGQAKSFSIVYPAHSPLTQSWFLLTVTPLAGDPPHGAVVMHLNITERKRAEVELRNSEAELKAAQRVARIGNWYLDPATGAVSWSEQIYRVFDRDPEFPPPTYAEIGQLLTVASAERMNAAIENSKQTGEPYETDLELLRVDDSTKWIASHGEVVRDDNGQIVGLRGTAQDISEKKRAEEEIQRYIAQIENAFMSTVRVVTTLGEMRDPYTAGHQRRVAEIAVAVGAEIGFDARRQEGLRVAGLLHDVGKIKIPAEILTKPGKLSPIQFQLIQGHAQVGYDILKGVEFPWPVAEVALQHHERINGSGYPSGLKGEAILLEAKILAVADVVEAMCSHRPYRPALGIDAALEEIGQGRGVLYDADTVDACIRLFREKGFAFALANNGNGAKQ